MSTVKISELALINQLNANTSNTLFVAVDVPTGVTGKFTGHTLAQGLYSNEILNVGANPVTYPGVVAQFSGNSTSTTTYLQVNFQNFTANGSTDYVASTSDSTNANSFIDMGISGKNYSDPVYYSAFKPYDGYVYVGGPTATSYSGNLILGTSSTRANIVFMVGGTMSENVVGYITNNGYNLLSNVSVRGTLSTTTGLKFADGSTQNTAANPIGFSQASFDKANNALANTTGTFAGSLTITNSINANTANIGNLSISNNAIYSSLTSTDMIIGQSIATANLVINRTTNMTKDLLVTGNITVQGTYVDFNNSTFNPNTAFIQITGSDNNAFVAPSNSSYMLHITGKANTPTRIAVDSFGTGTYPVVFGRMGRGSAATPLASANNDILLRIAGNGYTGTQFTGTGPSRIDFVATENFSDATKGTRVEFWNTPTGSNTIQRIASFNAESASFTGVVNPQKGFIYTPTQYPGAQTAITIDFANNSVIRANTSTGCTVSFVNYTLGKEVVLWLTNTAPANQTFTHGVNALNSTVNSTTYNIPGTSTIMARYFSFGNDLANTFVAVVHA